METNRRSFVKSGAAMAAALALPSVQAQSSKTVKVGMIMPFSGAFAQWGVQLRQGVELYQAEHGKRAGNTDIEIIYRDEGGPNPERSRQLAQELLVRERVDYLGGVVFTPNAMAIAPLATETKRPLVIMNAAQNAITRRSPYFVRTSFTLAQVTMPAATWALKSGIREAVIAVADYAPGHDGRDAFQQAFTAGGGKIKDTILVPLNTVDPVSYVQRILDQKPGIVFVFLPTGPIAVSFYKTFNDLGGHKAGIKLIGTGDLNELDLPAIGEPSIGIYSSFYYSYVLDTPRNKAFTEAYWKLHGPKAVPDPAAVAAYDGMHLIHEAVRKLGPGADIAKIMESMTSTKFDSPRGQMFIDPVERDIVQDVYIRKVERRENKLVNVEFEKYAQVRDPWKLQNKA